MGKTKERIHVLTAAVLSVMFLVSCGQVKDIAYFQDKALDHPEEIDRHGGIVQPKDMISIVVSSRNPELASMFNLPVVSYQAGSEIVTSGGQQRLLGYVVDNDGYIDFPVIGRIEVGGMTRWELSESIKGILLDKGYLNDAVVTVEFMNFKVSVLGEVARPGTYSIERVFYNVDLCSVDVFKSPAYNLQQNDIVYVEPSEIKARQSTLDDKGLRMTSIVISSGSLLVSVATLLATLLAR